ncbi:hypothetical protein [Ornithinibacillus halophilus]|uniref:hypothetical protein n=1 Tax=Ornithinibacillus halophilus TaxID=930117 RepID=UPI001F22ABE0|nr:hypothetical protein [Ornithinibacillus halophilus]
MRELALRNNSERQQTVLVFLFNHMNGVKKDLYELNQLKSLPFRVRCCADASLLKKYSVTDLFNKTGIDDWISIKELEREKKRIDQIYIPILPFSVANDLINFDDTRIVIRMMLWALMSGVPVAVCPNGINPYHQSWREAGMDQGTSLLKREMHQQLQKIKGYGIQFVDSTKSYVTIFKEINSTMRKSRIITEENVTRIAFSGEQELVIDEKTIITPLARDIARKQGIEIIEKRGDSQNGNGYRGWSGNRN